jgi:hypothetical protein
MLTMEERMYADELHRVEFGLHLVHRPAQRVVLSPAVEAEKFRDEVVAISERTCYSPQVPPNIPLYFYVYPVPPDKCAYA